MAKLATLDGVGGNNNARRFNTTELDYAITGGAQALGASHDNDAGLCGLCPTLIIASHRNQRIFASSDDNKSTFALGPNLRDFFRVMSESVGVAA